MRTSLFAEFETNLNFDTSEEAIATKDSLWTIFIPSRVFKGKRKIAIKPNCWKMTKSDNNQPLIRVYTHKNIINMVLIGLAINTQNYSELFYENLGQITLKNPTNLCLHYF